MKEQQNPRRCNGTHGKAGKGPTSYQMHDSNLVFQELDLSPGQTFLDLGCGPGDYVFHAAREVGKEGLVLAVDLNQNRIHEVQQRSRKQGIKNVAVQMQDMCAPLPFPNECVNTCLLSTSLHCLDIENQGAPLFKEIYRIISPGGLVAVLECKKEKMNFGPPLSMRISEHDVDAIALPSGFSRNSYLDLGCNYLVCYRKTTISHSTNNEHIQGKTQ